MSDLYRTGKAGPLSRLLPGQEFIIEDFDMKKENQELIYRLEQLGFQPGNKGICLYQNPGKGSLAFRINGSVIALRTEDAALIQAVGMEKEHTVCVMLTGNPNVGKSTVFNCLTGMHQHTGNWPGKTVELAEGIYRYGTDGNNRSYRIIDLPGTYSLQARSEEEEVTAEALKNRSADAVIVVCDASCLERSLRFALEVKDLCCEQVPVILCVNLCDEAERKGIQINFDVLESLMECRVIATCASCGKGMETLKEAVAECVSGREKEKSDERGETGSCSSCSKYCCFVEDRVKACSAADAALPDMQADILFCRQKEYSLMAENIIKQTVQIRDEGYWRRDYRIDCFLTSPVTGSISMLCMLFILFWLTIHGANYPSEILSVLFGWLGGKMGRFLADIHCPALLSGIWLDGIWRVSSWVVSVMLPPMAIFFPLFTILEDLGYLPRVAFHLDGCFKKCHACGKQALTMCMGLGCNAVGVTGCRIIDTENERLIAVLTNSLIPCNGRFPVLIAIITMFFAGGNAIIGGGFMCMAILLSIFMTFLMTRLLSAVLNKGKQSSFILELPPYRKPQFARILLRSLIDRTLFVLGRAVMAAAPAGLLIWILANIHVPEHLNISDAQILSSEVQRLAADRQTLLGVITNVLDSPAALIGLDGAILFAFVLGFPANEIVLPALLMCYLARGSLVEVPALEQLRILLLNNGWTLETAACMLIFTLFHWPCATTCMTIRKETGSLKWTVAAFLLPTVCGCVLCGLVHAAFAWLAG